MHITNKTPSVPVSDFKRTKILVTLGPSTNNYKSILELMKSGANAFRLNFSHGTNEERTQQVEWIRKASEECSKPVSILQDLQGPKIRLGDFEGVIPVQKGQTITLSYGANYESTGVIPIQYDLSTKVKRGDRVYIFDGKVRTVVQSVKDSNIYLTVENDGVLLKRKGLNLPDTDFSGEIITPKDKKDIAFGSTLDIDYVGLSFVHDETDIIDLKRKLKNLGSDAKVLAKIETVAALENLEKIIDESDAVMVARGDLAAETELEAVPVAQRRIVELCRQKGKPVIIATQMLATMTESTEPTRAEVSDVATAVFTGADCVMLSDETASGKYPVEAVKVMKRVIKYTEANLPKIISSYTPSPAFDKQQAITSSIITLARELKALAIVAETKSGATAINISSRRPMEPILAVTSVPRTSSQLALVYGVKSYVRPDDKMAAAKLTDWLYKSKVLKKGDVVVTASGRYPGVVGSTDTIKVRSI